MNKYKDKCDICNKFDILINNRSMCICKNCLNQVDKLSINAKAKRKTQLSLIKEYERKVK